MKDLKVGEVVHTVFRAATKEKHTSRGGKSYLALTVVDRTGEVDARVFDNVDAADQAFSTDDFLLVKGKIGQFHGKTQIVIERLERLDPGPIDATEFAWTPAPAPAKDEKPAREEKEQHQARVRLSKRLERLLEHPHVVQALDNFVAHLEKALDAQRGTLPPKPERPEKKPRGPKVEHKPADAAPAKEPKADHKPEAKRDPSLPEGLAFKPFNALVGETAGGEKTETPNS
ncbi:MAG: OB-fold nucleic acid binding domain-containing protein [Myxococcota bacterium]